MAFSFIVNNHSNHFTETAASRVNICMFDSIWSVIWYSNEFQFSYFWNHFKRLPSQFLKLLGCLFCLFLVFLNLTQVNTVRITLETIVVFTSHCNIHLILQRKTSLPSYYWLIVTGVLIIFSWMNNSLEVLLCLLVQDFLLLMPALSLVKLVTGSTSLLRLAIFIFIGIRIPVIVVAFLISSTARLLFLLLLLLQIFESLVHLNIVLNSRLKSN